MMVSIEKHPYQKLVEENQFQNSQVKHGGIIERTWESLIMMVGFEKHLYHKLVEQNQFQNNQAKI